MSVLSAQEVSFSVYARPSPILHPFNLDLTPGEFVVLLGHNGSGKSTLTKLLTGAIEATTGTILINGEPLSSIKGSARAKKLITLTQYPDQILFLDLTLKENIFLWESRFSKKDRHDPLMILELTGKKDRFFARLNDRVSVLSGGEKQLLLLALALAHPPQILFLDEHTSSLDPQTAEAVMIQTAKAIADYRITTIMVTHQIHHALDYGTRMIILKEGHIIHDQKKNGHTDLSLLKKTIQDGLYF
jgi:putative ABC transport system ATP-binding protein